MEDKSQEQNKEKPKVSKKDFAYMLVVAIFFDIVLAVIQLIPIAGSVAAAVFNTIPFMLFFIWYRFLGIDFTSPKKAFTFFGCSIIEFIPVINALPAWTASIIIMYILQKKDIILAKVAGVVGGAAGTTALAGTVVGAVNKNAGESLKKTSENLKEKAQNIRSNITPLRNPQNKTVGNEIAKIPQQNTRESAIIISPSRAIEEPKNISPFSSSRKKMASPPRAWVHRPKEARLLFPPPQE